MNREEVLGTRFSEFQDLLACDAIAKGFAEEIERKKRTQEEMYELE